MPRRRVDFEITMFPFLSVLCAIIGVMMLLLLLILGTRVVAEEDASAGDVGGRAEAEPSGRRGLSEQRYTELDDQVRRLRRRLDERRREHRRLEQLYARLSNLVAAKEDAAELADSRAGRRTGTRLGNPEAVTLVPDSKRHIDKTPIVVEARADGFVVHPRKTEYPLRQIEQLDSPLARFVGDVVKHRDRQYLLLLVHPNGVAAYREMREYLRRQHGQSTPLESAQHRTAALDVGKEPFSGDWLLLDAQDDPVQ